MQNLLKISSVIDALNTRIGQFVKWLILAAVVISAVNAVIRKMFNVSSNSWLEAQWYLFGAVFMLGAAYTMLKNEHIRIDVASSHFSKRTRDWIDVVGHIFFLAPFCWILIWHGIPFFERSYAVNEQSMNAGGLAVWPAKLLVPVGFALLLAQGFSELIKRIAILRGELEDVSANSDHIPLAEPMVGQLENDASLADRK